MDVGKGKGKGPGAGAGTGTAANAAASATRIAELEAENKRLRDRCSTRVFHVDTGEDEPVFQGERGGGGERPALRNEVQNLREVPPETDEPDQAHLFFIQLARQCILYI